jgi:hypothetical protein
MDQFYTKPDVSKKCINLLKEKVDLSVFDCLLEPSAGTGSFFNLLDETKRIGIDLEPKCNEIKCLNFFDFKFDKTKKYLAIGNPPFGRVCSVAVKFFNYAAEFCDVIAFIIPRTFKRTSIQNKLNLNFKLIFSEDLPLKPCCFEPKMNAKCCFQIWQKQDTKRKKILFDKCHPDFDFLKLGPNDTNNQPTCPDGADFALKAYGSGCGEIKMEMTELRPKSWHWIKSKINLETLIDNFNKIDYKISEDTVRQNSIGQGELIHLYKKIGTRDFF